MCLAADAQGKDNEVVSENEVYTTCDKNSVSRDRSSVSRDRESESHDSQDRVFSPQQSRVQGLSFRVLQWLTDTADDDDDDEPESRSCTMISFLPVTALSQLELLTITFPLLHTFSSLGFGTFHLCSFLKHEHKTSCTRISPSKTINSYLFLRSDNSITVFFLVLPVLARLQYSFS